MGQNNTRNVKDMVYARGFEPGVIHALEVMQEQINDLGRKITELAVMQHKIIDSQMGVVAVADRMKQTVDSMTAEPAHPELGLNTERLGRDDG